MKQQLRGKELFLVGVTLFSMFFGAGNLIFPPFVGYQAGSVSLPAFLGMALTAVCFPVLGVVAVAKVGGTDRLCSKIHPSFAIVFTIFGIFVHRSHAGYSPHCKHIIFYVCLSHRPL